MKIVGKLLFYPKSLSSTIVTSEINLIGGHKMVGNKKACLWAFD